jgi:hypothetical protein
MLLSSKRAAVTPRVRAGVNLSRARRQKRKTCSIASAFRVHETREARAARCQDDQAVISKLAELGTDLDAMEMIDISTLSALQSGANPGSVSSLLKLRWSQLRQDISELAVDAIGMAALKFIPERPLFESLQLPEDEEEALTQTPRYLNYRAYTILGAPRKSRPAFSPRRCWGFRPRHLVIRRRRTLTCWR